MDEAEVWNIVLAFIASLGGGGAIVVGLSGWLGKLWAEQLMERERAEHAEALERLRSDLRSESELELARFQRELEHQLADLSRDKVEKLTIYRAAVDMTVSMLAQFDDSTLTGDLPDDFRAMFRRFNEERMKVYAYMAMHAPQSVMDANDRLVDYLLGVALAEVPYDWDRMRTLSIAVLNEIRIDIGIDKAPIEYRGTR